MKRFIHSSEIVRSQIVPRCPTYIRCGVYMKRGIPVFDFSDDYSDDIILLNSNCSGEYDDDGVKYIYGYTYQKGADRKEIALFRTYIKGRYSDMFSKNPDVDKFVEAGVLKLDDYVPFSSIGAIVNIKPTKEPALVHIMRNHLEEMIDTREYDFDLVKEAYENVSFDEKKARESMKQAGFSNKRIDEAIADLTVQFTELKKTGRLFEMKQFNPYPIRDGFSDFLKFESDEQRAIFESLQGVTVLIYDDLITSGSTIKDVVRYLRGINNKNTLVAFALVKQH